MLKGKQSSYSLKRLHRDAFKHEDAAKAEPKQQKTAVKKRDKKKQAKK